ncbi:MAG: Mut7-C RNAse domain-containing protein [Syntrophorhabdaceae bacterium]|nr:Mut7-C RNAse domain-containing protein [Syntrophorhabdaceae bacterium]
MKFICDVMLGRLARYLRIFGLDAIYIRKYEEIPHLLDKSKQYYFFTKRTKNLPEGSVLIKSDHINEQLIEALPFIKPFLEEKLFFSRCLECNAILKDVEKSDVEGLVPEYIFHTHVEFKKCPSCNKIYWAGSHIEHMEKWIDEFLNLH